MRRWLPELCALPLLPWLLVQGKRTRRVTPRMPEAAGERTGLANPMPPASDMSPAVVVSPVELIAIGESPVAGVGVALQEHAITAQLAWRLAAAWRRPVQWTAHGKNGATAADAFRDVLPRLPDRKIKIVLIAFGVNDTTAFRSNSAYRRDLQALLDAVEARLHPDLMIVSGVPPLHLFPALPQPLRHVLGMKARALSLVAQTLAAARPGTIFVPVTSTANDRSLMAHDGYHPSESGVRLWAGKLAQAAVAALADPEL